MQEEIKRNTATQQKRLAKRVKDMMRNADVDIALSDDGVGGHVPFIYLSTKYGILSLNMSTSTTQV